MGVHVGVSLGVPIGVHRALRRKPLRAACSLAMRRLGFADIYLSMSSIRGTTAIAGGSRLDRCVSLAVALLTFAFWVDRPAA
jgi:hypothetical protein